MYQLREDTIQCAMDRALDRKRVLMPARVMIDAENGRVAIVTATVTLPKTKGYVIATVKYDKQTAVCKSYYYIKGVIPVAVATKNQLCRGMEPLGVVLADRIVDALSVLYQI